MITKKEVIDIIKPYINSYYKNYYTLNVYENNRLNSSDDTIYPFINDTYCSLLYFYNNKQNLTFKEILLCILSISVYNDYYIPTVFKRKDCYCLRFRPDNFNRHIYLNIMTGDFLYEIFETEQYHDNLVNYTYLQSFNKYYLYNKSIPIDTKFTGVYKHIAYFLYHMSIYNKLCVLQINKTFIKKNNILYDIYAAKNDFDNMKYFSRVYNDEQPNIQDDSTVKCNNLSI